MTDLPTSNLPPRSGGQILVDQLLVHGVDTAFCVPGESYLPVLDALYDTADRIRLVNARHEAGAANMAEAYGKLTGRPGICLVTRGPGACHAAVGVHTAFQDSTPMILLVGQVSSFVAEREAFQEIDYRQMFGPVAKWVGQIDHIERIPEYMARAFSVSQSGRPGPVVLSLPEDVLGAVASVADAIPVTRAQVTVPETGIAALRDLIEASLRPLVLIGGPGWSDETCGLFRGFCEANGLPVATSFRRQDLFDGRSESFVGDLGTSGPPTLPARVREADLLLVLGARLGEMTSQAYSIVNSPVPAQRLVHVHGDADEIGRVYMPSLAFSVPAPGFVEALAGRNWFPPGRFEAWRASLRREYSATLSVTPSERRLDPAGAMAYLRGRLPENSIITLDAGNHTGWPQRFLNFGRPGRQLGPTSGAMGYSVPAAVAASLVHPDRLVLGFVGDGGFMMSGLELAAAVQHGGTPIIIVFNNRTYGTIRMHQEREYPRRVVGTDLVNPDFVALAQAMGAHAERVEATADFGPAFERALAAHAPALLELVIDTDLISTRTTIERLRLASVNAAGPTTKGAGR